MHTWPPSLLHTSAYVIRYDHAVLLRRPSTLRSFTLALADVHTSALHQVEMFRMTRPRTLLGTARLNVNLVFAYFCQSVDTHRSSVLV